MIDRRKIARALRELVPVLCLITLFGIAVLQALRLRETNTQNELLRKEIAQADRRTLGVMNCARILGLDNRTAPQVVTPEPGGVR